MAIIKGIAVSLVILISTCFACACSNTDINNSSFQQKACNNISVKEILENLLENNKDENLNSIACFEDELFKNNCKNLYSIGYSELQDGGIAYAESGGLADEISILSLKEGSVSELVNLLEKRVERRVRDFTGYKPKEISKIENSVCFECGEFAVLIISDHAENLKNELEKLVNVS